MSAIPAILLVGPCTKALDLSVPPPIVTRNCSGCHGIDGRSQLPYIPRLAGQRAQYLERKLEGFRSAARSPVDEPFTRVVHLGRKDMDPALTSAARAHMGIAGATSVDNIKTAAQWFSDQPPAPGKSTQGKIINAGKNVFLNGSESQGLRACQTCHGLQAEGNAAAPRLAGQHAAYLVTQLALFRAAAGHSSPEMAAIARYLERDQAQAVAAYLQSQ